ncbi:MAG: acetyl-CoA C-acetyltransferase [Pseudomonadota bacterium]
MEVYITHAKRTAIGSFMGVFSNTPAINLGECVIRELLSSSGIDHLDISEVILGQVLTGGLGQNPSRQTSVMAGLPHSVPAYTIGKVCGSGLKAIALGAESIMAGNAEIIIAGGQENMSLSKHAMHLRNASRPGPASMVDMMMYDGLTDAFSNAAMGITAENIAKKFGITREMQDTLAYESQMRAAFAQKEGKFCDEIVAMQIETKKEIIEINQDEFIKPQTTMEGLAKLRPAFDKEGSVTAGNASGINDGAAAVILASKAAVMKYNLKPLARVVSYASAGVDPDFMGTGPVPASLKALEKAGWSIGDLDLIEANEAFAAQSFYVQRTLGLDPSKTNVNGGAIALGHPIGASGARILVTLLHEMNRRQAKKTLATLCIGGGMGISMCLEAV